MDGWITAIRNWRPFRMQLSHISVQVACHEPEETQEHILKCHHVGAHKKRQIWNGSSVNAADQTEPPLSCPRSVYNVYQILAWIFGNKYTRCEQCTWITMWIHSEGNCWSRVNLLAFGNERIPQRELATGSVCQPLSHEWEL
jgi:hypothetical protein